MLTIQGVLAKSPGQFPEANLKCYLVGFTPPVTYTNDRREVKNLTNFVACDTTGIIRGTIFNDGIVGHLVEKTTYIIQNFILKDTGGWEKTKKTKEKALF